MKYYLLTLDEDHGDEHDVPALACMNQKEFDSWKQSIPDSSANLGNNGGEYFLDEYRERKFTGAQYIEEKLVRVQEVDSSFYETFNATGLAELSLSNIFNEVLEDEEEEEEEYDEYSHLKGNYYETRSVGTRARSDKTCVQCGNNIPRGMPHRMHHFYPEFDAYPTHDYCENAFLERVK